MKRVKGLWDSLRSFENPRLAALRAEVGKRRLISAAPYRDRVVHHALNNVLEPVFERRFIHDSYACRKGKGTHAAVDRFTDFCRRNDYVLQCDIHRYFPSIDHDILIAQLARVIGDTRVLQLAGTIVRHSNPQEEVIGYYPGDTLFTPHERRRGIPIGNLTSQFFANVYLNGLDHHLKERVGCRFYVRYVDDLAVLGDDKTWLWEVRDEIHRYLALHLRMRLHPVKCQVHPVTLGSDFLGYRVFPTHRLLRRANGVRFARRLRRMENAFSRGKVTAGAVRQSVASWVGHASHADTYGLRAALLGGAVFSRAQTTDTATRVLRGGSWNNKPVNCRSANRNRNNPDNRNNNNGFRCVSSGQESRLRRS